MGGGLSSFESSQQNVINKISQNSNNACVLQCSNSNDTSKLILNNTIWKGNITISNVCSVSGSSCVLKSSLEDTLLNTLSNQQQSTLKSEQDLFTIFSNITSAGESVNETNSQSLSNQMTQNINSLCKFNAGDINNSLLVDATNSTIVGNLNYSNSSAVGKENCITTNMAKNYTSNDVSNSQQANLTQTSCTGSICSAIVAVAVAVCIALIIASVGGGLVYAVKRNKKGDSPGTDSNNSTPTTTPTRTTTTGKGTPARTTATEKGAPVKTTTTGKGTPAKTTATEKGAPVQTEEESNTPPVITSVPQGRPGSPKTRTSVARDYLNRFRKKFDEKSSSLLGPDVDGPPTGRKRDLLKNVARKSINKYLPKARERVNKFLNASEKLEQTRMRNKSRIG